MNKIGTINNPDDIFDILDTKQIRAIKSDIFCGFFRSDQKHIESKIPHVLRAIKSEGNRIGLTQEQGIRLINITNMMKDPETNKGHIQSFRDKMNSIQVGESSIPEEFLDSPSANVVDEQKRRLFLTLQAKKETNSQKNADFHI